MNSSLEPPRTVVFALCGSFCTFETVLPQIIRLRACGWEVLPMLSYAASALDTRFGRAADWKQRLEEATGHRPLEDLRALQHLELVVCRGRAVKSPSPKRKKEVDALLDPYLV